MSGFMIIICDEKNTSEEGKKKTSKHLYCHLLLYRVSFIPTGQDVLGEVSMKQNTFHIIKCRLLGSTPIYTC